MKRFNFLLTGILVVLLASCSQRTQITDSKPTVKIDKIGRASCRERVYQLV